MLVLVVMVVVVVVVALAAVLTIVVVVPTQSIDSLSLVIAILFGLLERVEFEFMLILQPSRSGPRIDDDDDDEDDDDDDVNLLLSRSVAFTTRALWLSLSPWA